jgi:hypothetical protein
MSLANPSWGVDVSSYQGDVYWGTMAAEGFS